MSWGASPNYKKGVVKIFNGKMTRYNVTVEGENLDVFRIDSNINGNLRYLVHFLNLDLKYYMSICKLTGAKKYTGKLFGGGYVFISYNLEESLTRYKEILRENNFIK